VKNKLVIYTALFGQYDDLIEPAQKYEECDFICFTDQKDLKSDIWEIRLIETIDLAPNMMNRKYKILPHIYLPEYQYSLYIDANIELLKNPFQVLNLIRDNTLIAVLKHEVRDCIYDEAKACVIHGKSNLTDTIEQVLMYKSNKFPKHFGLGANRIIFREHNNQEIISLMEEFWQEYKKWNTKRDQLILMYLIWKRNIKLNFIDENDFFLIHQHTEERKMTFWKKVKQKIQVLSRTFIGNIVFYWKVEKNG